MGGGENSWHDDVLCDILFCSCGALPGEIAYLHVFMAPFSESSSAIRVQYWFSIWTALILAIFGILDLFGSGVVTG